MKQVTHKPQGTSLLKSIAALTKKYFYFVGCLSFFINFAMLTVPLYMLQLYDRVLTSRNGDTLLFLTLAAVFMLIVLGVLELIRSRILVRIGRWLDEQLRGWLMHLTLTTGKDSQVIRDLDEYRNFLAGPGLLALLDAPWTPLFIIAVFVLHPLLGIVALVGALILSILAVANELVTRKILSEAGGHAAMANRFADQAARNSEVIRAMAMSGPLIGLWEKHRGKATELQTIGSDRAGVISAVAKIIRLGLQVAILGTGGWLAMNELVSPGVMIAASIIMGRALAPIEMAIGAWRSVISTRNAYKRLNDFLEENPAKSESMSLPAPEGSLSVSGLTYFVPGRESPILNNISFELKSGESLGITGPSAAGKSTLARMLVGALNPTKGAVKIDGFDLNAWNRAELGEHIGYLPQDVELFEGAINENIARFNEFDPGDVIEAAKIANIYEMIALLKEGFDTHIAAGGVTLSGGQRQRVALARASYKIPAIIVLDEPSSNLDTEGEHALRSTIEKLKQKGSTVVVVTHRPQLLAHVDKVLVVQEGNNAMFGDAENVLAQIARPIAGLPAQQGGQNA